MEQNEIILLRKAMKIGAVLIAFGFAWWLKPFTFIEAGSRGVVLRLGAMNRVLGEGFNYITPFVETVRVLDVRTQKEEIEATAASKDLQSVSTKVALNYHLDPERVGALWQEVGPAYKARIIDPAIQESVKAATAKYNAEELITKREIVKDDIYSHLKERLVKYHLGVDDLSITDFQFSKSFDAAIEAKVTAEQRALEAKNKLEQIKFEAEQKIATAKAEAQSVRLQAEALRENAQFIQLRQLEVQAKFADKWNGVLPVNLYGSAPIPFLQIK